MCLTSLVQVGLKSSSAILESLDSKDGHQAILLYFMIDAYTSIRTKAHKMQYTCPYLLYQARAIRLSIQHPLATICLRDGYQLSPFPPADYGPRCSRWE